MIRSFLLFPFMTGLFFMSCEKENTNYSNSNSSHHLLYAFKDKAPFEGEISIYGEDSTFIRDILCVPEEAIFIKGEIEYAYEITLKNDVYLFELEDLSGNKKTIKEDVKGDIILEWK